MNPVTLQRLLDDCYNKALEHNNLRDKLDVFCEKNWGVTITDSKDFGIIDSIADMIDYGNGKITVEQFREIMDEIKSQKQDSVEIK